ncbi:hypothetical protein [Granulicella tundricola]|nr:hypothetical protein [Granulicella tundricola]
MQSGRGGLYLDVPSGTHEGSILIATPEIADPDRASLLLREPSSMLEDQLRFSAEWQLALRIAASKGLSKSEFLPRFLLYVCEQLLTGSAREMTEQHLGTQVFNRPPGYNPGEDNIVRSYARMLRKRLDEFFEGEGQNEPLRLHIPRGGYVPVFHTHQAIESYVVEASAASDVEPPAQIKNRLPAPIVISPPAPANPPTLRRTLLFSLLSLLIGAAVASGGWLAAHSIDAKKQHAVAHALWLQLFSNDRNTLIVPADSGLGILENLTGHLVTLDEYTNGTYLSEIKAPPGVGLENFNDLRQQRYTSVVDLNITSTLTQLPEFNPVRAEIRYARSITTEDLKHSNAILLGSTHSNPWVSLFEGRMNFVLQYTPAINQSFVVNRQPERSEQATYNNGDGTAANKTYGLVDYLPSLDGEGHVLIIQGLNMAATQAAADTLANETMMEPILQQARRPDGSLYPFELLVQTRSIGASAPESRIVGSRIHREEQHPG